MDMDTQAPSKKSLLARLLDQGMVMVHLDARRDGVDVPGEFKTEADLRLNLSYRFAHGDLDLGEDQVCATLNFSGGPYRCQVPLPAIFAVVSHVTGEGFFFPGDAPPEALAALAAMVTREDGEGEGELELPLPGLDRPELAADERAPRGRPALRAIDGGGENDEPEAEDAERTHRPPHLRVVK